MADVVIPIKAIDMASDPLNKVAANFVAGMDKISAANAKAKLAADSMAASMKGNVDAFRSTGGRLKGTAELVGSVSTAFGGNQIGMVAGQFAGLIDKVSQFSEVAQSGAAGVTAFRLGLAGAAVAVGFQFGKAIGDAAFKTTQFAQRLAELQGQSGSIANELARATQTEFKFDVQEIELISDPQAKQAAYSALIKETQSNIDQLANRINSAQAEVDAYDQSFEAMFGLQDADRASTDAIRQQIEEDKRLMDVLKQQRDEIKNNTSERQKNIDALKEELALKQKSADYLDSLREELELLKAAPDQKAAVEAAQKAAGPQDQAVAESLLKEIEAEKEAQKLREKAQQQQESIAQAVKNEAEALQLRRIAIQQGDEAAKAYALTLKGISQAEAQRLAREEADIKRMEEQKRLAEEQQKERAEQLKAQTQVTKSGAMNSGESANPALESRVLKFGRASGENLQQKLVNIVDKIWANVSDISQNIETMVQNTQPSPGNNPKLRIII